MKTLSIFSILTLLLGTASVTMAGTELKYIELSQLGDPAEVLEVKIDTARALQSGEVRVKVLATPIHPSNLLQISGNYGVDPALPSTPGSEGVGRVVETSPEVTHLKGGQLVLLVGGGTWRDQIVAPATSFLPLPDLGATSDQKYQLTLFQVRDFWGGLDHPAHTFATGGRG